MSLPFRYEPNGTSPGAPCRQQPGESFRQADLEQDINIIETTDINNESDETEDIKTRVVENSKKLGNNISSLFNKKKKEPDTPVQPDDPFETIKKLSELKEMGLISQEEFNSKKTELLSKI